jgi:hypothetical protein
VYTAAADESLVAMLKRMSEKSTSVVTDDAGRFALPLPTKEARLDLRMQGRGLVLKEVPNVSVEQPFAAQLEPGAHVLGKVAANGRPLADADVFLQLVGGDDRFPYIGYRVKTDTKGAYRLDGLGSGEYLISIQFDADGSRFEADRRLVVDRQKEIKLDVKADEPNDDLHDVFNRWYERKRDGGSR